MAPSSILKFLHILTADVDDEIHIRHKYFAAVKAPPFSVTVVAAEGVLHQLFAWPVVVTLATCRPGVLLVNFELSPG